MSKRKNDEGDFEVWFFDGVFLCEYSKNAEQIQRLGIFPSPVAKGEDGSLGFGQLFASRLCFRSIIFCFVESVQPMNENLIRLFPVPSGFTGKVRR